jgi:hypothetical protein
VILLLITKIARGVLRGSVHGHALDCRTPCRRAAFIHPLDTTRRIPFADVVFLQRRRRQPIAPCANHSPAAVPALILPGAATGVLTRKRFRHKVFAHLLFVLHSDGRATPDVHTPEMAAPPTITENNSLFLARQATLKRSQRPSPKFPGLLGVLCAATKTLIGGHSAAAKKRTVDVPNILRPKGAGNGKLITVLRTIRRPGFTSAKQRNPAAPPLS